MGWNFGMLFTGFKVSNGSTHGAWRRDVMIPREWERGIFKDRGNVLAQWSSRLVYTIWYDTVASGDGTFFFSSIIS